MNSLAAALQASPADDVVRLNLANALFYSGRFEAAEPHYRDLHRRLPDEPAVLMNFPGLLGELGHHEEGRRLARRSAHHFSQRADLAVSHSSNLLKVGLFQEAEEFCSRLDQRFPGHLRANRGFARLFLGKWTPAWRDLEHRSTGPLRRPGPVGTTPWDGKPTTRPLYIEMEQGFGDGVLFLRYLPDVARRAPDVTVVAANPLQRLVKFVLPNARVVTALASPIAAGAQYARIMSLPHLLGQSAPTPAPYVAPRPEAVAQWAARLGIDARSPVLGVAWSTQSGSFNAEFRSLPVASVAPLLAVGFRLIALQLLSEADAATAREMGIQLLPPEIDFLDLAAIIPSLTAVVSIDTACAHVAGAVGAPVQLLHGPQLDWRWSSRAGCPWYRAVERHYAKNIEEFRSGFGRIAGVMSPAAH